MSAVFEQAIYTGGESHFYVPCPTGLAFCAAHQPEQHRRNECIVFLNAGLQNRAGPQRLYVQAARRFAEEGFLCVRVDLPGVGDSSGQLSASHFDTYNPEDVTAILDFIESELGPSSFHLLGLCAGARVATKATGDNRVVGMIAYGLPILSCPPDMPKSPEAISAEMSEVVARKRIRRQIGNIFRPGVWKRFFYSGGTIGEAVRKLVNSAKHVASSNADHERGPFLRTFKTFMDSAKPGLFVYGELDRMPLVELIDMHPELPASSKDHRKLITIANAGHTLSTVAAREEAIQSTLNWIMQHQR
jgi:pimeloyl-ACP methyl ester carboxylesterase